MSAEEVRNATTDAMAGDANTSTHDDVASGTAAGVEAVIADAEAQGTSGGSISADANTTVPTVQAVPAAAEQEALDASYNSGDSPYEISTGDANAEAFKAQADRVYGK